MFLSLGTWKETQVRIPGNDLAGVFGSLHFLEGEAHDKRTDLGERVVIIGGGNSAIDCARTAVRKGASATVIYRRERKDMPAIAEEVDAAEEEGVSFLFLASPHRIVGERGAVKAIEVTKTRLGAFDTSGRRRPIDTGEVQAVSCNSVILAVGEGVDSEFCKASGLATKSGGMLDVDRYDLTTSRETVYAGGDFMTGASNVVTAMSLRQGGRAEHRSPSHRRSALRRHLPGFRVRPGTAGAQPLRPSPRAFPAGAGPCQIVRGGCIGTAAGRGAGRGFAAVCAATSARRRAHAVARR